MKQSYDRFGHLSQWRRGDVEESYLHDRSGRLAGVSKSNRTVLAYDYEGNTVTPVAVSTGIEGSRFELEHDEAAGLRQIRTPAGHVHSFR